MTRTAPLAVAADYADALTTARRAKNWLFLLLALFLLAQLTMFLLLKFQVLKFEDRLEHQPVSAPVTKPATKPAEGDADTAAARTASARVEADGSEGARPASVTLAASATPAGTETPDDHRHPHGVTLNSLLRYIVPAMNFLGILFAIVLAVVLLLLAGIMLVGRLVGVSHVTSAFCWCVFLVVFLFPWQAFLISDTEYSAGYKVPPQPAFKVPGVLYTYEELSNDWNFANKPIEKAIIGWGRFVGFPVLALLILLMVQGKSSRGLRFALGEAEIQVEVDDRGRVL